ncbi:MAG: methylated-DNA--protein-cysteine methyltransferase [Bacteroidia bacterium]|nr:MAG: methylated-DNA--protein-cysteine methyltransferase [Bacteroidia bacterium]
MGDKDFFERVWEVVRAIPPGRVTTYGAIARYLGSPRAARLVGYALNASHSAYPPVPAHRVVNRLGYLTGKFHFPSPTTMQERLESEGIQVQHDRIQHFEAHFWDPVAHLPWPEVFFSRSCTEQPPL